VASIRASAELEFDEVDDFVRQHDAGAEGGRSYFFSKEALVAWTLQNRWTWRARGIRMNAVSPGPVDTPILQDFVATLGARAEEDMRVMDRPGTPADIAPVVAFLLSDASHLYAHCSTQLSWLTRRAPFGKARLMDADMMVDFQEETTPDDVVTVVATRPLTDNEAWTVMRPGTLVIFSAGEQVAEFGG